MKLKMQLCVMPKVGVVLKVTERRKISLGVVCVRLFFNVGSRLTHHCGKDLGFL